jgi:hypothetical protein
MHMSIHFCIFVSMKLRNRLRNNLVRKIQKLSTEKLTEVDGLLNKIESQLHSKEKTLSMAGHWSDLDSDFFTDLTTNLQNNRGKDRQIN